MNLYLNAGFGYPVGGPTLAWIASLGFRGIRQDIPYGCPPAHLDALLKEIAKAKLEAILIVGGWMVWQNGMASPIFKDGPMPSEAAIGQFAGQVASAVKRNRLHAVIEIGNEPTLTSAFKQSPNRYARTVRVAAEAIRIVDDSIGIAAGSIHDVTPNSREYLEDVLNYGIPERTIVVVHPYRMGSRPWDVFTKVKGQKCGIAMIAAWLRTIWPGKFGISEMGWHTAPRREKAGFLGLCPKEVNWDDDDVALFWACEASFWKGAGAQFVVCFQLNDGERNVPEDRFGIRRFDGTPKPVASVFKEVAAAA